MTACTMRIQIGSSGCARRGLLIDLTRLNDVHYSQPYFNAGLVLVSDKGLAQMAELPGHSLAYEYGSEADAQARTGCGEFCRSRRALTNWRAIALDAARLGDADAALVDAVDGTPVSARLCRMASPCSTTSTDNLYAIATQSRRPRNQRRRQSGVAKHDRRRHARRNPQRWL